MAIIKYKVEARVTRTDESDDRNVMGVVWQYEEVFTPERTGRLQSREEAMQIIREKGLVLVHKTPFGSVYDTPDEPFWEKHNGYYSQKIRNHKS